jgi:hypothetical protein
MGRIQNKHPYLTNSRPEHCLWYRIRKYASFLFYVYCRLMSIFLQILGQQMEIERMISEYESFTSDLLAWIEQVKYFIFLFSWLIP